MSRITSTITGHERKTNHFAPARISAPRASYCYAATTAFIQCPQFVCNCCGRRRQARRAGWRPLHRQSSLPSKQQSRCREFLRKRTRSQRKEAYTLKRSVCVYSCFQSCASQIPVQARDAAIICAVSRYVSRAACRNLATKVKNVLK